MNFNTKVVGQSGTTFQLLQPEVQIHIRGLNRKPILEDAEETASDDERPLKAHEL